MSNMQHAPGTVAMATVRGVPNVRAFSYECPGGDLQWDSSVPVKGAIPHLQEDVTDIRPLVVLDLDNPESAVRFLRKAAASLPVLLHTDYVSVIADQIEQQTKPLKPEEPTAPGSLVEDHEGVLWAKTAWGLWTDLNYMSRDRKWCDIHAVKVLRS